MKFSTKAIHTGYETDPTTGAIMPPIFMTSTFVQEAPGVNKGFDYTRANNPNFEILEKQLAALDDAKYATVFSSGLGALTGIISASLRQGDRVLAFDGVYGGTYRLFTQVFNKFGVEFITINPYESNLEAELVRHKPNWLFFETPTNPLLDIYDIEECSKLAKKHGVVTVVDNTFATPYCQNPLKLGVDIVWYSTTKYLGGHSDIIGGVAITNDPEMKKHWDFARKAIGLNPSPFDTWLVTRGAKTLSVRMDRHMENALALAHHLEKHPKVKRVIYPGLESHPKHAIAKKQMRGYSGMISVEFKLSLEETIKLISSLKLFALAESLGGVESLISHPASMTHASIPPEERERIGISDGLVRISVGIENVDDLIADLDKALAG
jgi:cystathionine beta-lyase/cystathionine gamma-synthase